MICFQYSRLSRLSESQIRISSFYFLILKPNINSQPVSPIILGQNTACITTGLIPPRLYPNLMFAGVTKYVTPAPTWLMSVSNCHNMSLNDEQADAAAGTDNTQTCVLYCAGSDCWLDNNTAEFSPVAVKRVHAAMRASQRR